MRGVFLWELRSGGHRCVLQHIQSVPLRDGSHVAKPLPEDILGWAVCCCGLTAADGVAMPLLGAALPAVDVRDDVACGHGARGRKVAAGKATGRVLCDTE